MTPCNLLTVIISTPHNINNSKSVLFGRSDGIKNRNPDFEFFTDEELYDFFCENKTKISTIEEPLMFLRHLKDNRLITDELYVSLKFRPYQYEK